MSDRGACVLSLAILIAGAMVAFVPRREAPVAPPTAAVVPPGSPVVQVFDYKGGEKGVMAVLPDGRYAVWSQLGSSDLTSQPKSGTVGK